MSLLVIVSIVIPFPRSQMSLTANFSSRFSLVEIQAILRRVHSNSLAYGDAEAVQLLTDIEGVSSRKLCGMIASYRRRLSHTGVTCEPGRPRYPSNTDFTTTIFACR